jgi:hypothetical protein
LKPLEPLSGGAPARPGNQLERGRRRLRRDGRVSFAVEFLLELAECNP